MTKYYGSPGEIHRLAVGWKVDIMCARARSRAVVAIRICMKSWQAE